MESVGDEGKAPRKKAAGLLQGGAAGTALAFEPVGGRTGSKGVTICTANQETRF